MKILVVEDDAFTNRMLEKYLTDLGFDVITADNGLKGWEIFCLGGIHFVLTDWMMPEMSGLNLIGKIRQGAQDAYCYIILLKKINDIYGHDAGDVVLKEVGNRITKNALGCDMISRIGGEEFLVVLSYADLNAAKSVAENMRKYIETHPVVLPDNTQIFITCSFGVFCVQPPFGMGGEACMKMADRALYEAKNSGRNKVSFIIKETNAPLPK